MAEKFVDLIGDGSAEKILMFFVLIHSSLWFYKLPRHERGPVGSPLHTRGTGRW